MLGVVTSTIEGANTLLADKMLSPTITDHHSNMAVGPGSPDQRPQNTSELRSHNDSDTNQQR